MDRKELIDKLDMVSPALSSSDLIPVMKDFCFTGTELFGFNDQIAISVPCDVDIACSIPGKTLLGLLSSSRAKTIGFTLTDDGLEIKASRSTFKLAIHTPDQFLFKMPEPKGDKLPIKNRVSFIESIEDCMMSVGKDTSLAEKLGITLIPDGKDLLCFSTDGPTLSHAVLHLNKKSSFKERVILPALFCQQLVKLTKSSKDFSIEVHDDYALLIVGDVKLFTRLLVSEQRLNFQSVLNENYSAKAQKSLISIPTTLDLIIDRAAIIAGDEPTDITVEDEVMKFHTKSDLGKVDDTLKVTDHPPVSVRLRAKLLKVEPGLFNKFVMTETCCIMSNDSGLYMVAAFGE